MEQDEIKQRLERIENQLAFNKTVLTVNELHAYTGIAVSQIYKLTSEKKIPHSKPNGKKLFFEKQKIDEWLLQNQVMTMDEINDQATNFIVNNSKSYSK